ncbi:MAG: putative FAD-linked oxidoreductase [Firmicutes bacterium ADurb.Bin153]|nr:MAG: putative FAD-linked oxidoreductase [Firmicutes bacterium ADurb.Bin153]HPU95862.1 FAD-binding oxidoreductase [Bacillota bacterium]
MGYNRIDGNDIDALVGILGRDRVKTGSLIHDDFCHDELGGAHRAPDVVVEPLTTEEVSGIMRHAWTRNIPVTPRGQGTGLVGGCVPVRGGILMDMSRMNKVLELDEENLVLTVEPGVLLMEIVDYTTSRGYMYPPDPGEKSATIGGNISTNAGGMRAVKYGVTRDYVRGLEVVLADGAVLELGGKVVKNSSGYPLKDLIVGSEGTLAVVTKAMLKLIPLPKKVVSLLVPFGSLETAIGLVPSIIRSKAVPTAVEFMERPVIRAAEDYLGKEFPDSSAPCYLLLSFDGTGKAEVDSAYQEVAELCLENGAIDVFISSTEERQEIIWKARGAFLEAIKASTSRIDECDVVVPRDRVADFICYTHELESRHGIRIQSFGHAGDGNLHVYVLKDGLSEEEWISRRKAAMADLYGKAKELRGQVSGEHGIGYDKQAQLRESIGATAVGLMKGIKAVFDPKSILNPGKVVCGAETD